MQSNQFRFFGSKGVLVLLNILKDVAVCVNILIPPRLNGPLLYSASSFKLMFMCVCTLIYTFLSVYMCLHTCIMLPTLMGTQFGMKNYKLYSLFYNEIHSNGQW